MSSRNQIKSGALISYFSLAVNILVTLIYTPWMVNKIGSSNYGLYTLSISIIGVFLLDFGLSSSISKFISKYIALKQESKINEFVSAVLKLYFIIDIFLLILFSVLYLFLDKIYTGLSEEEISLFKILYIIVAGFNLISFPMTTLNGILNAHEEFFWLKICDLINKLLSVFLVIVVLSFNLGVVSVVAANATAGLFSIIIKAYLVRKKTKIKLSFKTDFNIYKELFSFSIWSFLSGISQRLTLNLAPSILAITSSSIAVAVYSPASAICSYYYNIAAAINGLFLPHITRLVMNEKKSQLLSLMVKVGRYQTLILGLIFAGFFCVGDEFMVLWMGPDFKNAYYCTLLIMLPAFFEYSQQIGNTAIVAMDYIKQQSLARLINSILGVIVSYLLALKYDEIGLCVGIFIAGIANVICFNIIHKYKIGLDIKYFYLKCYGRMSIPIIITCVLGRIICSYLKNYSLPNLVIKIMLITIFFLCSSWVIALSPEEHKVIINKVRK